jgi:hypothetical protein
LIGLNWRFFGGFAMAIGALKNIRVRLSSVVVGSICAATVAITPSKADFITDRVIQNVIQNILQDVRDQIQSRRLATYSPGRLQFTGEDANVRPSADDPFSALAYAKAPYTKAPPMAAPALPTYIYGLNLTGSGDWSRAGGITTSSFGVTGSVDVTKIGIFSQYDAITFIGTGMGVWSHAPGVNSGTGVGAGTVAYTNGGFSTDFTVDGTWTSSSLAQAGIITHTDSTGVSYAPNVHYKFELGNNWYIEPTVGATYTQTFDANFGTQTGDNTEVHGGARFGTETTWNTLRVQPQLTLEAFSLVAQSGVSTVSVNGVPVVGGAGTNGVPTGQVGGRASGKLNFLWTPTFSSFVEAHGSAISGLTSYGALGGVRWTF